MKFIQKLYALSLLAMAVAMTGCERDYDAPPLNEPAYEGAAPNITLAELKEKYSAATDKAPITIDEDLVLKAYITGNDESGNIYKQIFVQDETGAMPIQIDQGNVYTTYRRGQEVFINLKGMCVSVYGGEQQLGWPTGYLYRMPYADFEEHVQKNKWPDAAAASPEVITDISAINLDVNRMLYRLVQLEGVYFENGGKNTYAKTDGFGEENLKDAHGNALMVRTSNYASFAYETLPVGTGKVIGILGRFKGTWQLSIPTANDVFAFDGVPVGGEGGEEGGESGEKVLFSESFGAPEKVGQYWPKVKDYNGFDNDKSLFTAVGDKMDVRSQGGDSNVWFPYGSDNSLTIGAIELQGATKVSLVYKMWANVYKEDEKQDVNTLSVKVNDTQLEIPGKELVGSNNPNLQEEVRIDNIPVSNNVTLVFSTESATNVKGIRLYDVKLVVAGEGDNGEVIKPEPTN